MKVIKKALVTDDEVSELCYFLWLNYSDFSVYKSRSLP
jgi:hypothetical protein